MKPDFFIKSFRNAKIVQLILLSVVNCLYALLLIFNKELRTHLSHNSALLVLCIAIWGFLLLSLIFLYYDFSKLRSLASETHILSQLAFLDTLTGIPNRYSLDLIFRIFSTPASVLNIGCMVIKITNLKSINETLGRTAGDKLIQDFCSIFESVGDCYGHLGRNSGNEFVIVIENCLPEKANHFTQSLTQKIDAYNAQNPDAPIAITIASVLNSEAQKTNFKELLTLTYDKLHNM